MQLQKLLKPEGISRVETGSVQFGDDWPGVFIRGDNACWYGALLMQMLQQYGDNMSLMEKATLQNLATVLSGCRVDSVQQCVSEIEV